MKSRTEKDLWIEMSIREIWAQAHFAEIAFRNIDQKAEEGTDLVFSSIHSFLSHCAMVSKMLLATSDDGKKPKSIGNILGIRATSVIHKRTFRNRLEHYDEHLKEWINQFGTNVGIATHNIGPKSALKIPNLVFVSHYDPTNQTFTFVNEDFDLRVLASEIRRIKSAVDKWVKEMEQRRIIPPFA